MTPQELYNFLDYMAIDYEVVEIFEGVRVLRFIVQEEPNDD